VGEQERDLGESSARSREQRSRAAGMQVPGFEEQQRKEEGCLMGRDESERAALPFRLRVAPREHISLNIGVAVEVVGVPVVSIVFIHPPAVTKTDAQIRYHHANSVIPPLGQEQLLVTRVVAKEAELRENNSEVSSDRKLPPRLT
jgi:hypothetical protein